MKIKRILLSYTAGIVALTMITVILRVYEPYPLKFLEYKAYDAMMGLYKNPDSSSVVIVGIDTKSINLNGNLPWSRGYYADIISRLSEYNAGAIGMCLLFTSKANYSGDEAIQSIRDNLQNLKSPIKKSSLKQFEKLLVEAQKEFELDQRLINAVRQAKNIVLPFLFIEDTRTAENNKPLSGLLGINSIKYLADASPEKSILSTLKQSSGVTEPSNLSVTQIIETYRELAGKAGALGHLNIFQDPDGIVRWVPLLISYKDRYFPSLPLQLAAKYSGTRISQLSVGYSEKNRHQLQIKSAQIPTDSQYRMLINFDRETGRIPKYSIHDVYEGKISPRRFANKIVLLGIMSDPWTTSFNTPVSYTASPVELLAYTVDNILNRRIMSRPSWAPLLEIGVILYFCLFLLFIIPRVKLRIGGLILAISLSTWVIIVILLYQQAGLWLYAFYPVFLTLLGYLFAAYKHVTDGLVKERLDMNRTLGLSFQSQGLLDMAYEKFIQCPIEDKSVKDLLYDLGLDFERKRQINKALNIYQQIAKAGKFKDVKERIDRLRAKGGTVIFNGSADGHVSTLLLDSKVAAPTFGRYEILKELGQGAMGTVYLGKDPKINREVAIKTLEYSAVPAQELSEIKERFFREAETAGKLSHSNIVTIFDIGEEHDIAYMAMELLDGEELSVYCQKDNLLPIETLMDILTSVGEALGYAHKNGVVHRDVKPANIMLLKNGLVKVTDFGIARVVDTSKTRTGIVLGTPSYMSPEQISGKKVGGQSDLFSLGVVFYELLTGEKPFKGDNLTTLMYAIAKSNYTPLGEIAPHVPSCCVDIVDKLLYKALNRRFKTAELFVEEMNKCRKEIS